MNYLDFCEELFDKLTQDISQDYSDSSSFFGFTNLIDCNWTKGVGFTLKFKIPTLNNLIFYEHLEESFVHELFALFTDGINQTGWRKISCFISDVIKRDFLKHLTKDWVFPL